MTLNVPNLRFPGFEGEWCFDTFQNLTKINQGLQIAISERLTEKAANSYFYITNEFLKQNSNKKYYIVNPHKSVLCTEEDILMTRTGNTGQVVTNVSGAFHNNFFKIKFNRDLLNKTFFESFLKLKKTQSQIMKFAGASTIPDLNHSDFYKIKIAFPELEEQNKIASTISLIEARIQTQIKIIEQLESLKKGVMQKLFSQEIRFKNDDGEEFAEWEEMKFHDVFEEVKESLGKRIIEPYSISAGVGFISQKKKFGKDISGDQSEKYTVLKPGQFAYNKGNSKTYKYGCIYMNNLTQSISVPNVFICFSLKGKMSNKIFYAMLFESHYLDRKLRKIISSSARMDGLLNVNKLNFFNLTIPLPIKNEQDLIAKVLESLSKKIDKEKQMLQGYEQQKKYLLQNLFI